MDVADWFYAKEGEDLDDQYDYYEELCNKQGIVIPYSWHKYWAELVRGKPEDGFSKTKKPKGYSWGDKRPHLMAEIKVDEVIPPGNHIMVKDEVGEIIGYVETINREDNGDFTITAKISYAGMMMKLRSEKPLEPTVIVMPIKFN